MRPEANWAWGGTIDIYSVASDYILDSDSISFGQSEATVSKVETNSSPKTPFLFFCTRIGVLTPSEASGTIHH